MPKFSESSEAKLDTCHYDLRKVFYVVVQKYDCSILVGHRTEAEQNEAFGKGNSQVKWPDSKHNSKPSRAVDVAPYPIDWKDRYRFAHFAGYVQGTAQMLGVGLRWGGDWDRDNDFTDQTFDDLVHFELIGSD